MCCVSFRRLCLGHHISCAVLQISHVCCQTAHTHDGGLLRNTGRTSYKWTNICTNRVSFCTRKHNLDCRVPVFAQLLFSWSETNPPTTNSGGAREGVTFEICWHKDTFSFRLFVSLRHNKAALKRRLQWPLLFLSAQFSRCTITDIQYLAKDPRINWIILFIIKKNKVLSDCYMCFRQLMCHHTCHPKLYNKTELE